MEQQIKDAMKVIRANNLGKRSYDEDNDSCLYRNEDGNKCLVGCFIDDAEYTPDMEGQGYLGINDGLKSPMPFSDDVMNSLQGYHDNGLVSEKTGEDFFIAVEHKIRELVAAFPEKA
mgnify:CR=1 FL=1|jgi:hypothetical protein|tara:strand:+ start:2176 stop:2526 length:351 start_codon:yes stop_codon:yes gene_type:complete